MNWILCAIGFLIILIVFTVLTVYFVLRKSSCTSYSSKYILNKFEPDNTAPKISELIEFHKANEAVKYNID